MRTPIFAAIVVAASAIALQPNRRPKRRRPHLVTNQRADASGCRQGAQDHRPGERADALIDMTLTERIDDRIRELPNWGHFGCHFSRPLSASTT
jgi:hypothetical protein